MTSMKEIQRNRSHWNAYYVHNFLIDDSDGDEYEIELELFGHMTRFIPATRLQPEEGNEIEEVVVFLDELDITDWFNDKQLDEFMDLLFENYEDSEPDYDDSREEWEDDYRRGDDE